MEVELPESMKLPAIAIMTGLRQLFPTIPEKRFVHIVTTELAAMAIEVAQMDKDEEVDFRLLATKGAERVQAALRKELS